MTRKAKKLFDKRAKTRIKVKWIRITTVMIKWEENLDSVFRKTNNVKAIFTWLHEG